MIYNSDRYRFYMLLAVGIATTPIHSALEIAPDMLGQVLQQRSKSPLLCSDRHRSSLPLAIGIATTTSNPSDENRFRHVMTLKPALAFASRLDAEPFGIVKTPKSKPADKMSHSPTHLRHSGDHARDDVVLSGGLLNLARATALDDDEHADDDRD